MHKILILVGILMITGCSVLERLVSDPEIIVPVVEKVAVAAAAPSLITVTDAVIAVIAAITGAASLGVAQKCVKKHK